MHRWADYLIYKVAYNRQRTHIVAVLCREDLGDKGGPSIQFSRQAVIDLIDRGKTFVTAPKDPNNGKMTKGSKVELYRLKNTLFIKTQPDRSLTDNLDELPEFEAKLSA